MKKHQLKTLSPILYLRPQAQVSMSWSTLWPKTHSQSGNACPISVTRSLLQRAQLKSFSQVTLREKFTATPSSSEKSSTTYAPSSPVSPIAHPLLPSASQSSRRLKIKTEASLSLPTREMRTTLSKCQLRPRWETQQCGCTLVPTFFITVVPITSLLRTPVTSLKARNLILKRRWLP